MTEYAVTAGLACQIPLVAPRHRLARVHLGIERVEILRAADATQRVAAGGDEIAPAGGVEALVEFRRGQQLAIDRTAHRGDAADLVHGRTDHGEIEPVLAADIAVEDLADMQADIRRTWWDGPPRPASGSALPRFCGTNARRAAPRAGHAPCPRR